MYKLQSYKDLIVWQKAITVVELIYSATKGFPKEEQYGLVSQMRRAAVSIPCNIAEGYGRNAPGDYRQFYSIAYGSLLELETQLVLSNKLGFATQKELLIVSSLLEEVSKMLHTMILKSKQLSPRSYKTNN